MTVYKIIIFSLIGTVAVIYPGLSATITPSAPTLSACGESSDGASTTISVKPNLNRVNINGVEYDTTYTIDDSHFSNDGNLQKFIVNSGSTGWSGDHRNGNERIELVTSDVVNRHLIYQFGEDIWLSYRFMVERGQVISAPWGIVGQFHDWHDDADRPGLSPPLSFVIDPTRGNRFRLGLWTRSDAARATLVQIKPKKEWSDEFERGKWIAIVLHLVPRYDGKGVIDLWVNGKKVLQDNKASMGYNNPSGFGYWQFGIYRKANMCKTVVEYSHMEQSRNSLAGRIKADIK